MVRSASDGSMVGCVGGVVVGERVSGREGGKVGTGEGGKDCPSGVGGGVVDVGRAAVGEMVPRLGEDRVGIGVGGGDWLTAVGGAVGDGGTSAKGCSVGSGLGGNVDAGGTEGGGRVRSVGVGGAVTAGMAADRAVQWRETRTEGSGRGQSANEHEGGDRKSPSCSGKETKTSASKMAVDGAEASE